MVCTDCVNKPGKRANHAKCKRRNKNKQGSDCDCQHRKS